jgi:hypothetical protein
MVHRLFFLVPRPIVQLMQREIRLTDFDVAQSSVENPKSENQNLPVQFSNCVPS